MGGFRVRVIQALRQSAVQIFHSPAPETLPALLLRPRARLAALEPEMLWDWAHLPEGGASEWGRDTTGAIAALLPRLHWPLIALVVPGEDALVLDLRLPPGAQQQGAAAAPFLVEDYLLEEIEAVHIALARAGEDSVCRAVAINAQCLVQTLADLAAAGLPVASAWVDHELLAAGRGEACCFRDGERRLLCAPGIPGFAGPPGVAMRWAGEQGVSLDALAADVSAAGFFRALHWPFAGHTATNLLQGNFEPPARSLARRHGQLRLLGVASLPPVLLAVFALALGLWHSRQTQVLQAEAQARAADHPALAGAPSLARALDAQEAQSAGRADAGTPGFDALLGALGAALSVMAPEERPRLLGLRFERTRGYLEVLFDAGGVQALQTLQGRLEEAGTATRLLGASRTAERFEARVRVGQADDAP